MSQPASGSGTGTAGATLRVYLERYEPDPAKLDLGVNAGHGLNYLNIKKVAAISGIEEFNIGHAIISRAVLVGLDRAVRDMVELVKYA